VTHATPFLLALCPLPVLHRFRKSHPEKHLFHGWHEPEAIQGNIWNRRSQIADDHLSAHPRV